MQLQQTIELGPAWAGNSVNCVPYRVDAVRTYNGVRYVAYFDDAGDIVVAGVDPSAGSVARAHITNSRKPYDAHQAISLGIDPTGHLHLAFGAHASSLLVTRSRSAELTDGFEEIREDAEEATYPMFLTLKDQGLVRLHRRGRHNKGAIYVDRLAGDSREWTRSATPLISGLGQPWSCGPYLNTPVVAPDGSVHLFLVWRLNETATSAGAVVNVGLDALVAQDGLRSVRTHRGVESSLPVTPLTSERVIPVPLGASLINQAAAALLPTGKPAALTYWDAGDGIPQYRLCWLENLSWRTAPVSSFRTPFRLDGGGTLPLPHSRPELLIDPTGRALVLYRSREVNNRLVALQLDPPDYVLRRARPQTLVDEDLDFYEPIVDRAAWSGRGELVMYVQRCAQGMGRDGQEDIEVAPARLMTWTPG
ncbi:BNR-4 repeat-containing protein [Microvirga soli]|uniref:BNR-4 repeat-containing protein n=1 Tax=Microvirga soli TaxID=1854496 RepID=UPI00191D39A1|nr:BNR-4 repeat-containing protein [Microvirga soli]